MTQQSLPFHGGPAPQIEADTLRMIDSMRAAIAASIDPRRARRLSLRDEVEQRLAAIRDLTPDQARELANRELLQQRCPF